MDDFDQTQAIVLEDLDEEDATDELGLEEEKKQVGTLKVVLQKGLTETSHQLYEGENVIGRRAETCHICIPSKSLSKEHACIQIVGDSHLIYDKGSQNKTRRGKLYLTPEVRYELQSGDEIIFADVKCVYTKQKQELKGDDDGGSETDNSESFLLQAESTLEISAEINSKKEENNNMEETDDDNDEDIFVQATQPFTKDQDKRPGLVIQESPVVKGNLTDGEISTLYLSESESEEEKETPKKTSKKSEKSAIEETQFFEDSDPDASLDFTKFGQATQAYNVKNKEEKDDINSILAAATQAYGGFDDNDNEAEGEEATQSFLQPGATDKHSKDTQLAETQSFDADGKINSESETQSFDIIDDKDSISSKKVAGDLKSTQVFEEEDDGEEENDYSGMFATATLAPVRDSDEEMLNCDEEENDDDENITAKLDEPTQAFDTISTKKVEDKETIDIEPNTIAMPEKQDGKTLKGKKSKVLPGSIGDTVPADTKDDESPTQVFDETMPVEKTTKRSPVKNTDEDAPTQVFDTCDISHKVSSEDLPTQVFDASDVATDTVAISNTVAVSDTATVSETVAVSDTAAVSETVGVSDTVAVFEEADTDDDEERNPDSVKDVEEMETQAYGMGIEIETQAYDMDEEEEDEDKSQVVGQEEATQAYGMLNDDEDDNSNENTKIDKKGKESDNQETCVFSDDDDSDVEQMSMLQHKEDNEPTQAFDMEIDEEPKSSSVEPTLAYNMDKEVSGKTIVPGVEKMEDSGKESNKVEGNASNSSSALSIEIPIQSDSNSPWVGESQYSPELEDIGKGSKFVSCLDVDTQGILPDSSENVESSQGSEGRPPLIPLPSRSPLKPALVKEKRSPSPSPKHVAFAEVGEAKNEAKPSRVTRTNGEKTSPVALTEDKQERPKRLGKGKKSLSAMKKKDDNKEQSDDSKQVCEDNVNDESEKSDVTNDDNSTTKQSKSGKGKKIKTPSPVKEAEVSVRRSSTGRRISRNSLFKDFETTEISSKRGQKTKLSENKPKSKGKQKVVDEEQKNEVSSASGSDGKASVVLIDEEKVENKQAGSVDKGNTEIEDDENSQKDFTMLKEIVHKTGNDEESRRSSKRGKKQSDQGEKIQKETSSKNVEVPIEDKKVEQDGKNTRRGTRTKVQDTKESKSDPKQNDSEEPKNTRKSRRRGEEEDEEKKATPAEETKVDQVQVSARRGGKRTEAADLEMTGESKEVESKTGNKRRKRSPESVTEEEAERSTKRLRKGSEVVKDKDADDEKVENKSKALEDSDANEKPSKRGSRKNQSKVEGKSKSDEKAGKSEEVEKGEEVDDVKSEETTRTSSRQTRKQMADKEVKEKETGTKGCKELSNDDNGNEADERREIQKEEEKKGKRSSSRKGKQNVEDDSTSQLEDKGEKSNTKTRKGRKTAENEIPMTTSDEGKNTNDNVEETEPSQKDAVKTSNPRQRRVPRASNETQNENASLDLSVKDKQEVSKGRGGRGRGSEILAIQEASDLATKETIPAKNIRGGRHSVQESKVSASSEQSASFQTPIAPSDATQSIIPSRGRKRALDDKQMEGGDVSIDSNAQGTPKKQRLTDSSLSSQSKSPRKRTKLTDSQESFKESTPTSKKAKMADTPQTPSQRESLSSSQILSSPSLRKSTIEHKPKVLFTGVIDQKGEKILKDLGGELASSIQECTHLVTDKIRRTVKFLGGMAKGVPIVTPHWLENCKSVGTFLDGHPFLVKDPAMEKQFNFNLSTSVTKAQTNGPLFQGYKIHVTKSVKPDPNQMKDILHCAGAEFLPRMPSKAVQNTVVISCPEDEKLCKPAIAADIPVSSAEFILTGILRQEVDFNAHALFKKDSPQTAKGKNKKR